MKKRRLHAAAALFALALAAPAASAQFRLESLRPDLGVVYVPNLDPDKETPDLITYVLGCGFVLPFNPGSAWSFEPAADLFTAYYELDMHGRSISSMDGEQDAFVVGLVVEAPVVFSMGLGERFRMSVGLGPAFNLRAAVKDSEAPAGRGAEMNAYFWQEGRFFEPTTFLRGEYRLTDNFEFGFAARAFWPVFNSWTKEGFGFLDQGIFGGSLGVRYRLKGPALKPDPESQAAAREGDQAPGATAPAAASPATPASP